MKSKVYYKIVDENMESWAGGIIPPNYKVKYKVGEWVKPVLEGSNLFCFENYNDALLFTKQQAMLRARIYKCHIKNRVKNLPCIASRSFSFNSYWQQVFKCRERKVKSKIKLDSAFIKELPSGTVMCKQIKLLGLVCITN